MATGDIIAVRIASASAHNGWVAEIDIDNLGTGGTYAFGMGVNNDPTSAKIVFTVISPGYNAAGEAITRPRTVYGTQWVRQAYPNQAVADEGTSGSTLTVRVSLSDFIYTGETATVSIGGGFYTKSAVPTNAASGVTVTNNSTLAYPSVIGRWAWPAFETVTSDFLIEAVCLHRFAKDGKPVAAVQFSVSDGTHTQTIWSSGMTVSSREGAGSAAANKVLVYAATIPIGVFDQGAVLTCNFTAYPWVGTNPLTSATGITPPDERLTPHLLLCDKNSTYGGGVAVVDTTNGQASTASTWVYASQATAESNYGGDNTKSYNTIGRAAQAIKSYNNSTLSRDNPGGGVILLSGGAAWPGTVPASTLGAQDTWLTITRLSTVTRANAQISSGTNQSLKTQKVKCYDITLTGSSNGQISGTVGTDALWIDNCDINLSGTTPIYVFLLAYATRNAVPALANGFNGSSSASTQCPYGLIRGNVGPVSAAGAGISATFYAVLGNYNIRPVFQATGNAAGHAISENAIAAFNTHYGLNQEWMDVDDSTGIATGMAFVQNVIEKSETVQWATEVDGENANFNNIIVWHCTFAGARIGVGFNWSFNVVSLKTNYSVRGTLFEEYGNKDDTMPVANAIRTGSWPVGYDVGCFGNHRLDFAGTPEWAGEFSGLHTVDVGTWGFLDNASATAGPGAGDGSCNGNYHLLPSASGYALIPASYAVLPFDLEGRTRNNGGGGSAGAYEMNRPAAHLRPMKGAA